MDAECTVSVDKQPWDGSTVSADPATKRRVETNTSIKYSHKLSLNCTMYKYDGEDIIAMKET